MDMGIRGRRALVNGASAGMGLAAATARRLVAPLRFDLGGWKVFVHSSALGPVGARRDRSVVGYRFPLAGYNGGRSG